ncbi:MAG: hypothetical protein ABL949_10320 [Fimbriimonadaceae bacterium]
MALAERPNFVVRSLPLMGTLGFALSAYNVWYAQAAASCTPRGCCLFGVYEFAWMGEGLWVALALGILLHPRKMTGGTFWRQGLAIGIATWGSPIVAGWLFT